MAITKATASSIAPAVKGDLVAGTATNDAGVLGVGANNTVLTADSAEATGLKWATASSGGMTQLATGSLSGSVTSITSISASYIHLFLAIYQIDMSSASYCNLRFNNDSGANQYVQNDFTSTTGTFGQTAINYASNNFSASTIQSYFGISILNYADTTHYKNGFFTGYAIDSGGSTLAARAQQFWWKDASAINRIDIPAQSGTMDGGTYVLWGVK